MRIILWVLLTLSFLTARSSADDFPKGGLVLAGGGDLKETFEWMIERSGGGDFVVLASSSRYNDYIRRIGGAKSVETLTIVSRAQADSEEVVAKIKGAEAIFIGGGDQSEYVKYWKGTKLLAALNAKFGQIPIGGVSAGMALMGEFFYQSPSDDPDYLLCSHECLQDPFVEAMDTLNRGFLEADVLQGVVTDTHYSQRKREGRHVTFMARLLEKFQLKEIKGIGVDQNTACCIDHQGRGHVVGEGNCYFLKAKSAPEVCVEGKPLSWGRGVEVQIVQSDEEFSLTEWSGGKTEQWFVEHGELKKR